MGSRYLSADLKKRSRIQCGWRLQTGGKHDHPIYANRGVIPYEKNPRKNDNAVDAVAASVKEFGFKVPIVVDRDNVIVAGHTRLKAAQKLGLKEVPVVVADDLSPEQVKAFRLADNKTAELAGWDFDLLDLELGEIADIVAFARGIARNERRARGA